MFCEGRENGSLDSPLLSRLLGSHNGWTIVPGGTKEGLVRYAEGYRARGADETWLVVRDRDFDQEPTPQPTLLPDPRRTKNVVCTWRTSVESYLLDPRLIHRYWVGGSHGGRAEFRNPEPPEQVQARIQKASAELVPYQSLRWALAALRQQQPRALRNTWTRGSGWLPPQDELGWDQGLLRAQTLVEQAQPQGLDPGRLQELAESYRARFEDRAFLESDLPLIWFSPKDIAKQMQRQDPNLFGLDAYFSWAVDHVDISSHPDLVQLRERLRSNASP